MLRATVGFLPIRRLIRLMVLLGTISRMPRSVPFPLLGGWAQADLPLTSTETVSKTTASPTHPNCRSLRLRFRIRSSLFLSHSAEEGAECDRMIRSAREEELRQASALQLAPMMDYTDRHFRHLVRLVSSQSLLYTEMVAANALAHERRLQRDQEEDEANEEELGDPRPDRGRNPYNERYLAQGAIEPLEGASVLQLGGSCPQLLYEATQAVLESSMSNYTALNLNCGCPSPKVAGKGCFGAALMEDPALVAQLVRAMHEGGKGRWPVSVKCRIGTDSATAGGFRRSDYRFGAEEYGRICRFVETVAADGIVSDFAVHARIAVLSKSFSPAENRKIPPLEYDVVRRLATDYPELRFTLNGGVETLDEVREQLDTCPALAGVMVGRAWAADPWSFAMADELLFGQTSSSDSLTRLQVLEAYCQHADHEESAWDPAKIRRFLVKAVQPLFAGEANAKRYRIALDEIAGRPKRWASSPGNGGSTSRPLHEPLLSELLLRAAHEHLSDDVLLRTPRESYEMRKWQERRQSSAEQRSLAIAQWQAERKQDPNASYNRNLHHPEGPVQATESSLSSPPPS